MAPVPADVRDGQYEAFVLAIVGAQQEYVIKDLVGEAKAFTVERARDGGIFRDLIDIWHLTTTT